MWGTYWVWDARLTSVLLLFFLYLGHIALIHAYDDPGRGDRAAAILALVGAINVPIIKFSVDWWNTLHQPASVMKLGGPSIHPAILIAIAGDGAGAGCFTSCWCCCAPTPRSIAAGSSSPRPPREPRAVHHRSLSAVAFVALAGLVAVSLIDRWRVRREHRRARPGEEAVTPKRKRLWLLLGSLATLGVAARWC